MTRNFRLFSHGTLLAGVFLAVSLLAAPPAHAVKADELVKINSATIDPPLKAGGSSTLKVAATVIPDWHINSDKPFSEDYIPTKLEVSGPVSVTPGAIKYPPAETMTLDPAAGGDKISVFGGDLKFEVPLKAAADFAPKPGDELTGYDRLPGLQQQRMPAARPRSARRSRWRLQERQRARSRVSLPEAEERWHRRRR